MSSKANKPAEFTRVDWDSYSWKASPDDPHYYTRSAGGGEVLMDFMNRFKCSQHNMFRGLNITMAEPISTEDFLLKVRNVWEVLRYEQPIIALHSEYDENENLIMTYRAAENLHALREWTDRTVRFCEGETDLDDLRFLKGQNRVPEENGDQTFLYVIARSSTSYGMLFHSHHTPFDGVGMKIMFTKFCKIFASGVKSDALDWGKEGANLLPGFLAVLNENEVKEGPVYEAELNTVVDDYFTAMERRVGVKPREVRPGPTRRHSVVLSVEESAKLLKGVKALGFTLNVVAHAALCIMTQNENPWNKTMPPDASYVFYGLVNCRDRMSPPYNSRDAFTGWGLGINCLSVPVSVIAFSAAAGPIGQLKTVSAAIKTEYLKQKDFKSLLAIEERMTDAILHDRVPGVRPPPWTTPSFSGDGKGEVYMDREYSDPDGKVVIGIDDFFPSANVMDPGSFFRLWSWRDQMTLSVDYNTAVVAGEDMKAMMDDWLRILRTCYVD